MSSKIQIPKTCQHCGKAFIARTTVTQFCGDDCAKRNYKLRKREAKVQQALKDEIITKQTSSIITSKSSNNLAAREFLSIQEASQLLGASRWTIQRMIKQSKISYAKLGKRTIIKRSEIDKLFIS
jgi:excisionase family DNA binding protein